MISESEIQLIDKHTKNLDMQDIGLFWQLTIKTIEDLKIVSNESLTLCDAINTFKKYRTCTRGPN